MDPTFRLGEYWLKQLGDSKKQLLLPGQPFYFVLLQDAASNLHPLYLFPENTSKDTLAVIVQRANPDQQSEIADGMSMVTDTEAALQLARANLPTLKALFQSVQPADVSIVLTRPLWRNRITPLLKSLAAVCAPASNPASVPLLLAAALLKDVEYIHLAVDPERTPRRLSVVVQAAGNTALSSFFSQPSGADNPLVGFVPADGGLRVSLAMDGPLSESLLRGALDTLADSGAVDAGTIDLWRQRAARVAVYKGNAAFSLGESAVPFQIDQVLTSASSLAAPLVSNMLKPSTATLAPVEIPSGTPRVRIVLATPDTDKILAQCQAFLDDPDPKSKAPAPKSLLLPGNATQEKFPIHQVFTPAPGSKATPLPPAQAILSAVPAGQYTLVATRFDDMSGFIRRSMRLDALCAPLEAQRTFVNGAQVYADYRPGTAGPARQPYRFSAFFNGGRARFFLILP